jgi:hypothetical protein
MELRCVHESPGPFGAGVADYALDPRYARLLWDAALALVRRAVR